MKEALLISLGGALGALSRHLLTTSIVRTLGTAFPFGTLAVNGIGSFLLGFVMQMCLTTNHIPPAFQMAVTIGFLGAFTTFSTFSYETLNFFRDGGWHPGMLNIAANIAISIGMVLLGMVVARSIIGEV